MVCKINDTSRYHKSELESLGWELTVCNMLEDEDGYIASILETRNTFGNYLYRFLAGIIDFNNVQSVIEVGGGYGYLMRDFLLNSRNLRPVMLDISSYLLSKQQEILKDHTVSFLNMDFFETDESFLSSFDLAVLNENISDFPTVYEIHIKDIDYMDLKQGSVEKRIKDQIEKYKLTIRDDTSSFNLGAIEAVEKLCKSGIKYIYIGEQSCESALPDKYSNIIDRKKSGNPERIPLMGHDEYTINFSHLEAVAGTWGYEILRGQFYDFIKLDPSLNLEAILASPLVADKFEIIRHFVQDLYKYEYLILIKS